MGTFSLEGNGYPVKCSICEKIIDSRESVGDTYALLERHKEIKHNDHSKDEE